jgi:hypothetical protein
MFAKKLLPIGRILALGLVRSVFKSPTHTGEKDFNPEGNTARILPTYHIHLSVRQ